MEFYLFETGFRPITKKDLLYDIMTTMRGPDIPFSGLKTVFTGRLRYWVFGNIDFAVIREYEYITWRTYFSVITDIINVTLVNHDDNWEAFTHYLEHINNALEILYDHAESEKLKEEISKLLDVVEAIKDYIENLDKRGFQLIIDKLYKLGVNFTGFEKYFFEVRKYVETLREFIDYMKKLDRW